jgi:hypothetical protein
MPDIRYTMGLDLGQTRNYTAMVVLERQWSGATARDFISSGTRGYQGEWKYTLVRVERVSLGTPYPRVVDWVRSVAREYGEELASIVVDASGVGSAVVDALRRAELGVRLIGVVITGNQACPPGRGGNLTLAGYQTVSRAELLTGLQMAVQSNRFAVDRPRCREWDALRRELSALRLDGGTSKSSKSQDDLAFALALAIWWGMRLR